MRCQSDQAGEGACQERARNAGQDLFTAASLDAHGRRGYLLPRTELAGCKLVVVDFIIDAPKRRPGGTRAFRDTLGMFPYWRDGGPMTPPATATPAQPAIEPSRSAQLIGVAGCPAARGVGPWPPAAGAGMKARQCTPDQWAIIAGPAGLSSRFADRSPASGSPMAAAAARRLLRAASLLPSPRAPSGGDHIVFIDEVIQLRPRRRQKPLLFQWGGAYQRLA